ncbi:hypothetical protein [Microvirga roseola]|uniref:hypothetical protein n=1 Tax=Microvirga roseola TaxID=2883126 RepID=UPI001E29A62F|nr:hypothetical protein [Microvirga roseola]
MTGKNENERSKDSDLANSSLSSSRRPAGTGREAAGAGSKGRAPDDPPAPDTKSPDQQIPKR